MADLAQQLQRYSRDLFGRLEEFFVRAIGQSAHALCPVSEFDDVIRARASKIAPRAQEAFNWLDTEVRQYQA